MYIFRDIRGRVNVNLKKKGKNGEWKSIEIKRKYSAKWIIKVHRFSFVSAICKFSFDWSNFQEELIFIK